MGEMLSQAEIDMLLKGVAVPGAGEEAPNLTAEETDAIGEIGNICMGTAATTLFTLLGKKVTITTPKVKVTTWEQLCQEYVIPYVAVRVEYTNGLLGSNLLILKEDDVKVIVSLMMGGDGKSDLPEQLSELHLSAISEAMNQMVGSSATSMSSMFNKRIEISPPKVFVINFDSKKPYEDFQESQEIVKVAFKMVVDGYIDSEIMQLLPISFAKNLVSNLLSGGEAAEASGTSGQQPRGDTVEVSRENTQEPVPNNQNDMKGMLSGDMNVGSKKESSFSPGSENQVNIPKEAAAANKMVNVQPIQFQSFEEKAMEGEKKNIDMLLDIQLEVTVELGRTQKMIREILEFGPGSVIELDKLAGEPVDIFVNGKPVAKGEVVVIDESFGVRVTDIIQPSKRL